MFPQKEFEMPHDSAWVGSGWRFRVRIGLVARLGRMERSERAGAHLCRDDCAFDMMMTDDRYRRTRSVGAS